VAAPTRFSYTGVGNDPTSFMPRLAMTLHSEGRAVDVLGLVDTGTAANVLPHRVGSALDANWAAQPRLVPLVGGFGQMEVRELLVLASHPQLTTNSPVPLAFAWAQEDYMPVLFGQINFFMLFDVCFYRAQGAFEVQPREGM
jgi:hypothetical protein